MLSNDEEPDVKQETSGDRDFDAAHIKTEKQHILEDIKREAQEHQNIRCQRKHRIRVIGITRNITKR